jgi:hypothetical protein
MKPRSLLSQILRIFFVVVLITLAAVAIIAGIGWWAGWQTEEKFKTAIQIAGLILIGIGFLGIKGNGEMPSSYENRHRLSASTEEGWNRIQQKCFDFARRYSFLLILFAAGGICLSIGWLM